MIQPGSLPGRLGFENGDVVRAIQDQPVFTAEDAFAAYYVELDRQDIAVSVLRGGAELTLHLHID